MAQQSAIFYALPVHEKAPHQSTSCLFVYGTLRRGARAPMARWLNLRAAWIGRGSMPGRLKRIGGYPGLMPPGGKGQRIYGDLFRLPRNHDALLRRLDAYEECGRGFPQPHEYRRVLTTVRRAGGEIRAWTYIYQWNSHRRPLVRSGDFLRPD